MPARTVYDFDGERLRELRELRGVSREELAAVVGVGYPTIGRYENGWISPSEPVFRAIARYLRVRRSELIDDAAA